MDPMSLVILGLVLVAGAFSMIHSQRRVRRSQSRDALKEADSSMHEARESVINQIRALEVRLLEQTRAMEAELSTKMAILEQLIEDADARIAQLRTGPHSQDGFDQNGPEADERSNSERDAA